MSRKFLLLFGLVVLLLLVANVSPRGNSETIVEQPIHWHAHLAITIKNEHVIMPAGVGLTQQVLHPDTLHTHLADNEIHMEMDGPVKASQITLGEFFKVWGKRFDKRCIFDNCASTSLGTGGRLHFLVNGRLNDDFDKYVMRNDDQIEILFE